ncbi:phosphatidate cytidylyltransferase [Natranaerovirga hydrolytica]|uniref:Phosphatidate cytidylyltransferase n=1 Tax=Natranaerovirga hydrolytica TaxID=680378 RepID=A0A4R1N4Q4_9FIRM|nr:phosphatidate cytidylyltransferase [Natranaerovirga hydrolytica]TCK97929.1 phosphatidate cytidylyltransferase [Natranaerovirga hydrolytica]
MKLRVLSSIIGLPITLLVVIYGELLLLLFLGVVAFIGLYEIYNAFKIQDNVLKSIGYLTHIAYFILIGYGLKSYNLFLISVFLMILLITLVIKYPKYELENLIYVFFGFFYVSFLFSHIYFVRELTIYGEWIVWLIFISAWGSDTFAYATGLTMGKHLLAPNLSPKKTIEGSIGGIIGAMVLSSVYGYIFIHYNQLPNTYIYMFAIITFFGAIISQIGDLAASAIKRKVLTKDFGHIIPGHGGIIDRFDSIIFTAPFIYYISFLILNHMN